MKLSSRQRVTRRDLVRLVGSAAVALPCLELFGRELRAQAAGKVAKYAVFCYTPDGVNQSAFWPTGGETDFQLSPILTPFAAYKDKLLVMGPQVVNGSVKGGSGLAFDWERAPRLGRPVFLAGGLRADNVGAAIAALRPHAVDVSSGIESAPGCKDGDRMQAFLREVQRADQQ